jgi:hypothetical protein
MKKGRFETHSDFETRRKVAFLADQLPLGKCGCGGSMRAVSFSLHRWVFFTKARVERVVYQCSGCGNRVNTGLNGVKVDVQSDKLWDPPGGTLVWLIVVGAMILGILIMTAWVI